VLIAYVDDAGNTGINLKDSQQPYHTVLALLTEHSRWRQLQSDLLQVVQGYLPDFVLGHNEIHTKDLFAGRGLFNGSSLERRQALANEICALMLNHDLKILGGIVNKQRLARKYVRPSHPYEIGFILMVERLERYCVRQGEFAIIVQDESDLEEETRGSLRAYQESGIPLGDRLQDVTRVIETVFTVKSEQSVGIQLSDFVNHVYFRNRCRSFDWGIREQLRKLEPSVSGGAIRSFPL